MRIPHSPPAAAPVAPRRRAPRGPLLALATALALAGCAAVGPDYRPETPSHPQDWSEALPDAAATDPATLTQWWQAFNDPLLDLLQEQALARNQDLAIARLRLA
ncbi:hypothetical protein OIJ07_32035, partial [Achromobacter ruhlandii]|nr:hypothetical protein [Achromobacter ruhlandii]